MNAILEEPRLAVHNYAESALETIVYTIGYEGRSIFEYQSLLSAANVQLVIDVRMNPISRKKGFSKTALSSSLSDIGVGYLHIKELGIESSLRKNLGSEDSYEDLFALYASVLLPSAREGVNKLYTALKMSSPVALTCFERDAIHCHRHCISDYLFDIGALVHEPVHL